MLSSKDPLNPAPSSPSSAASYTPASGSVLDSLRHDTQHLSQISSPALNPPLNPPSQPSSQPTIEHDIGLNRKTRLRTLFRHSLGTIVEYPETHHSGYIGHLFKVSPDDWSNPQLNFAYSQGPPTGLTKSGHHVWCPLLVDNNGEKVPCQEVHSTCMYSTQ
jgi:hypothetical protein